MKSTESPRALSLVFLLSLAIPALAGVTSPALAGARAAGDEKNQEEAAAEAGDSADTAAAAPVENAEKKRFRVGGYFKSLTSYTSLSGWPDSDSGLWDNFSRVRLETELDITPNLTLTVHYVNYAVWGDSVANARADDGSPSGFPPLFNIFRPSRPTLWDLESTYHEGSDLFAAHGLDRLYLDWNPGPIQLVLGRQEVAWGWGYFWTPVDVFAPFAPLQMDKEEKDGVDMARLVWPFGDGWSATLVHAPKEDPETREVESDLGSSGIYLEGRLDHGIISALGARHRRTWIGGLSGFQWLNHRYAIRGEASYTGIGGEMGSRWDDHTQVVLGLDRHEGGLILALEGYYNSIGAEDSDDYLDVLADPYFQELVTFGEIFSLARYYTGLMVWYERASAPRPWSLLFYTLVNVSDGSFFIAPRVTWTPVEPVTLELGIDLPFGPDFSEYGSYNIFDPGSGNPALPYPDQYTVALKWRF